MCWKITYPDKAAAIHTMRGFQRDVRRARSLPVGTGSRRRSRKKPVKTYYCAHCKGWHLTSRKNRMKPITPTTKQLNTRDRFVRGRLMVIDFTSSGPGLKQFFQ